MPIDCDLFWRLYVGKFGDTPIPFCDSFDTEESLSDLLARVLATVSAASVWVELGRVFDILPGSDDLFILWSGVLIESSFFLAFPPALLAIEVE